MGSFKVNNLRWLVGLLSAVVGAMMLITPHQFHSPVYAAIAPNLSLWGAGFLLVGVWLLSLAIFRPRRAVIVAVHLLAGAGWLTLAYGLAVVGGWTGTSNFAVLGLATALAPFLVRPAAARQGPRARDLFGLTLGLGAVLTGASILIVPGQFANPIYDIIRPFLPWFGLAFLGSGLALAYAEWRLDPRTPAYYLAYLAAGLALLVFFVTSAIPLRAWIGFAFYGGFGAALLALPWLRGRLDAIDPASLQVRLAFALAIAASLPMTLITGLLEDIVAVSDTTTRDWLLLVLLATVAITALVGAQVARWLAAPLHQLARAAGSLAVGNAMAPLPTSSVAEVSDLARTFADMRDSLASRTAEREQAYQRLNATLESITDGFLAVDREWRYTYFNETGAQMIGMKREDLIGGVVWELFPLAEGTKFHSEYHRAVETGLPTHFEEYYPEPLNLWLECHCYPSADGLSVFFRDVSERRQAEEELRRRAEEVQTLMDVTPAAIWVAHDPSCHRITGNRMANQFYEATAGENVSAGPESGVTVGPRRFFRDGRELRAEELPMQVAAAMNVEVRDAEFDVLLPSGHWRTLLGSATPLREAHGQVRGCIATFVDITERKQAEEALRRSEERLRLVLANSPDIAFVQDRDLRYTMIINPAPPLREEDVLGKTDFDLLPEEQARPLAELKHRVMETGEGETTETVLSPGGIERWYEVAYNPLRDAEGQVVGLAAYSRDISERKRAEGERERLLAAEQASRAEAEKAVRVRDEFIFIAAHELKTPVTSLQGFAQLLLRQYAKTEKLDPDKVSKAMATIEQQTERLSKLTEQLLNLSRLEAGRLSIAAEETDLAALVASTVEEVRHSYPRRTIELHIPKHIRATADPLRFGQVVTNLLDNALKFSPANTPVAVTVGTEDGWAIIAVRDHGMGIPDAKRDLVFERFYQAHDERHYGGMGIGLYISRQIVQLHNGSITVEAPEDGGSRFVVRLPLNGQANASGGTL